MMVLGALGARPAAAGGGNSTAGCDPGWYWVSEHDNSFVWTEGSLPFRSVSWTGSVVLLEEFDADCYVVGVEVDYTGPVLSGTLDAMGPLFVSFTVQHPGPFTNYANVAVNAYGDLIGWGPWTDPLVQPHFDINDRGADEFYIQVNGPATVPGVYAHFSLPTDLVGQTIYAQIHVGQNLCQCSVTSIDVPGSTPPPPSDVWSVFVHAHNDDWQLFESPDAYHAYQSGDHVMWIYMTAGDAGQSDFYWHAREEASKASTREVVGAGLGESTTTVTACYGGSSSVCHDLTAWSYGTTISIFMRLPDGGIQGGGFPSHNYETMEKLRDRQIASLGAVDGSTRYESWADLYQTLAAAINAYAPYAATTSINAPDFDRDRQTTHVDICPDCPDHADHLAVADAVYAITIGPDAPWGRAFYIDYPIDWADSRYPENLDQASYEVKKAAFMAYNQAMKDQTGVDEYNQMPWFWENAFHRDYVRTV